MADQSTKTLRTFKVEHQYTCEGTMYAECAITVVDNFGTVWDGWDVRRDSFDTIKDWRRAITGQLQDAHLRQQALSE